jgi:hypothetical protein
MTMTLERRAKLETGPRSSGTSEAPIEFRKPVARLITTPP